MSVENGGHIYLVQPEKEMPLLFFVFLFFPPLLITNSVCVCLRSPSPFPPGGTGIVVVEVVTVVDC